MCPGGEHTGDKSAVHRVVQEPVLRPPLRLSRQEKQLQER